MKNQNLIKNMSPDQLIPYENNPRFHGIKELKESIENFGFRIPVVVDKDHVIITGHGRWQAAQELGIDSIPVIVASDLSDDKVREYRIADNKVADLSGWNIEYLEQEMREIKDVLQVVGFEAHEITKLTDGFDEGEFKVYSEEDIQRVDQENKDYFKDRVDSIQDDYLTLQCEKCGCNFSTSYRIIRDHY